MDDEKGELIDRICMIDRSVDALSFKQNLYIILRNYRVERETFEIAQYEGDVNENIIKKFLISKTVKGCTESTIRCYKAYLIAFADYVNKPLTQVQPDDIRVYIAEKAIKDKVSKEYQRNIWRGLSSFYGWALIEEIITKNPMFKVECPKKEKRKKKAFSDIELEIMRKSLSDKRERAIFETLLSTWCRVSEMVGMNITDVYEDGSIEVIGKGQKARRVYLNAKAKVSLEDYIKGRNDESEALWVSSDKPHARLGKGRIEKICKEIGERSGVVNCHPHRFRRTGATMALRAGMPIQDVSRILGHESIETTQIYLDIDEKEVERSHEKYVR